jgi:DNA-binding MarR family transcriptional regulator
MTQRRTRRVNAADETADKVLRSLIRAYGLLNRAMQPFFARHGISPSQWGVLRVLERARRKGQARLRMADLSQRLWIRPPSVTGVVDRLERQGLLRRCASSNDLRTKEVCLTAAGEGLVNRIVSGRHEHVESVMCGLNAKERKTLAALLGRFIERLEVLTDGKAPGRGQE